MRLVDRFHRGKRTGRSRRHAGSGDTNTRLRGRKLPVWKRIWYIILADLLALGLIAVLGEVTCRLSAPQVNYGTLPEGMLKTLRFSEDMYLGWELRAGERDHNSAGMRGGETTRKKPENVWRIAMIGDSVTYGLGVDAAEAFPSVLDSKLNAAGLGPAQVLNFGVPGYSTFQEYTLLKTRVFQFEPDLVVMTFTPDDVETSPVIINVGGELSLFRNHFEGFSLFNNSIHWAIFRRSHFYRFLYKHAALACSAEGTSFDAVYVQPEVAWQNVRRATKLCNEKQTAFLLVLSPFLLPFETQGELREIQRHQQSFDWIRGRAQQSQLQVLDLGPVYDEHLGKLKVHSADYEHLNPLGHELVAEKLFEKLLLISRQSR